ncbi:MULTISPECIES: FMN-dependent NADH-azoreductase [Actinoalloteichus]|uniref:FMN dependent NADH:quinone oxidoreductase n=1 Tax=Actinoalloteichus fjordicus TaxID=1612552 RepID=A0AAC9L8D4_9PSEU|nr:MULTISPECIES: NAD(P)H-dependent oxidoreductase [Actinoalloteichus]APU12270.1 acyl carrier protein phosphodiesterase [Actinoalloteichus fjordicus]APU18222.1 acyl carrier protein phosphodiesterase [Actinoalloteichus sp. GBA129-24]
MSLFRLDASIRPEGSVTREIADAAQSVWQDARPGLPVVRRDLTADPIPSDVWASAALSGFVPVEEQSADQRAARALATTLADELVAAEAYLFAVPLYNYGVSQHFKTWVDLILTDPRLGPGGEEAIAGRPAVLITAQGGGYGPGTPKEGWDHATPWMVRALSDVLGLDLQVSAAELTLAEVTPGMEGLVDMAKASRDAARDLARTHGRSLADRIAGASV